MSAVTLPTLPPAQAEQQLPRAGGTPRHPGACRGTAPAAMAAVGRFSAGRRAAALGRALERLRWGESGL